MKENIVGIQQIGIGVPDVHEAWDFYRKHFGMDIPVFQESAEAKLMTKYTGGKVHARSAVLAINISGGGGMEIWQYTSREPQAPKFEPKLGDLGLFAAKIKSPDVNKSHQILSEILPKGSCSDILKNPAGEVHFYVRDPFGNYFDIIPGKDWFRKPLTHCGGVAGSSIGVGNMEKSLAFYRDVLGFDKLVFDGSGIFDDLAYLPGGNKSFRRVILERSKPVSGTFSRLLGQNAIELLEAIDYKPRRIFEDRYWGDQGFIHLCFDVYDMKALEGHVAAKGHPFTINSGNSFDMGEASGHFTYCEDPDGTWIEFVETYRIPVLKVIGWYLNLGSRDRSKPLPDWMLGALRFTRKKD
jgi:catechol 2,3-dioxygenase-like lactoylglutathione lyase family enzyme